MRPADEIQVMAVQELAHHIGTKRERNPTIILAPALNVLIWI